jgi:hypothetical protein
MLWEHRAGFSVCSRKAEAFAALIESEPGLEAYFDAFSSCEPAFIPDQVPTGFRSKTL